MSGASGFCIFQTVGAEPSFSRRKGKLMNPVTEAATLVRDRAGQVREQVGDKVQASRDRLELNVHKHPVQTVLLSLGAGMAVGLVLGLLARRSRD